jgi:transcription initiation factor IIE alpha subunit
MKINQQSTSIDCYHKVVEGEYEASQNAKVYDQIKKFGTMSGGMIAFNLDMETNAVGRSLNSLNKEGVIERAFKDKCQISKINVWYWQIKKKVEPAHPGIQLSIV